MIILVSTLAPPFYQPNKTRMTLISPLGLSSLLLSLLLLFHLIIPSAATPTPSYNAVDLILLNCGAPSDALDIAGRRWDADDPPSKYMPQNANSISFAAPATRMDLSIATPIPYQTARVFHSPFTYSFPVSTMGHKFIRLHFYPDSYAAFNTSQSLFSLTANGFTLLANFSAFLHSRNLSEPSLSKEFVVYADGNLRINLTFSPNPNSFAFINGIEIVSIPDELYYRYSPIKNLPNHVYYLENNTALETLYRVNVGGTYVPSQHDAGMFRYWSPDDAYILGADSGSTFYIDRPIEYTPSGTPPYSAPTIVYRTYRTMTNMSTSLEWIFPVDSGFHYLFRFHFCEDGDLITRVSERVFTISIDNRTAEEDADVIAWASSSEIPVFKDYVVLVPDDGRRGKTDLRLSLFPQRKIKSLYYSALLNGLEIFKLSDWKQSLAAANPEVTQSHPVPASAAVAEEKKKKNKIASFKLYIGLGTAGGVVVLFFVIVAGVYFQNSRQTMKLRKAAAAIAMPPITDSGLGSALPSHLCRYFSLEEILTATHDFDDRLVIGKGGFGNVYKGFINGGTTMVAVKRLNSSSKQGAREFLMEIKLLSELRHLHLVSLIGYCNDNREMILVYDYMARGTLRTHIYNNSDDDDHHHPLSWKQRLQICLDAARGLEYLHTGTNHAVIHRDVKSTNILLDENLEAKVSDFGLSKICPTDPDKAYVSTAVKGSFGYIDPEYYRRKQLTEKSDVFSFGVVLFEVLCNRPAVLVDLPREQANLAEWAKSCYREGTVEHIIDPNIKAQIAPECLYKFVETAIRCVRMERINRPAMNDVVWNLAFALKLQLAAEEEHSGHDSSRSFDDPIQTFRLVRNRDPEMTREMFPGESMAEPSNSGLQGREDFSELVNPRGR